MGNLDQIRDFGWAPDYINGMFKSIFAQNPDDYIFSTMKGSSLKTFATKLLLESGLNPSQCLEIDKKLFRKLDISRIVGNNKETIKKLDWYPENNLDTIIKKISNLKLY